MLKKFITKHSWVLTCFLAVVLIPQSITLQSKLEGRLIITGLAIEKKENDYEITAQIVSPSSGIISGKDAAGIDFVSVRASTIREGITKIAAKTTKSPGLGHMNFLIIGESVFDEDLIGIIDFIVRDAHTDTSVLMLVAANATKELKNTKSLELGSAIQLRKAFLSKHNMCNGVMTIANKFLADKFNPSASSIVSYIEIEEENAENEQNGSQDSQSMQSNGNKESSGEEKLIKQGRLKFTLPLALFRDGKYKGSLSQEAEINGYNMLCCSSNNLISGFVNLPQTDGSKAKITLLSKQKSTKVSVRLENEKPKAIVKIKLSKNQILELIPTESKLSYYKTQQNYLTKDMKKEIEEQIKQNAIAAFSKAQSFGVDILEAATRLYRQNKKEYDKYFKSHTLDDFISSLELDISVSAENETK